MNVVILVLTKAIQRKTSMTTSISSEAQKSWNGQTKWVIEQVFSSYNKEKMGKNMQKQENYETSKNNV